MSRAFVVVTGANGFIGRELCARFRGNGRPVLGLVRNAAPLPMPGERVIGDLLHTDEAVLAEALAGAEAVVHLAGRAHVMREEAKDAEVGYHTMNAAITERVARAAVRAGVRRFVLASSVKVMGEETQPGRPFRPDDVPLPRDAYARSKLAAERALFDQARGGALVPIVLRLPLVYGRNAPGNFPRLVAAVMRHRLLPLGAIDNRRSILYVGNLAAAIESVLDAPKVTGGIHFVTDAASVSTPELVLAIADAWHVSVRLLRVPVRALELAGTLLGRNDAVRRLTRSLEADATSFRQMMDWAPPCTLQRALATMAASPNATAASDAVLARDPRTR